MSTTAELRFRVQAPNARARATAVVSLDAASEAFVRQLAARTWNQARFLKAAAPASAGAMDAEDGWLWTIDGERTSIADEVTRADQVIMVAGPGGHAVAVTAIGRECSRQRVTTTGLIVGAAEKFAEVYVGPMVGGGIESWFAYVVALLFLLVRPEGLFGEKRIDRV